jgi:Icc-related predicted phosphoesterase
LIRVAAIADLHFGIDSEGSYRPHLERVEEDAEVLLIAGDLTRVGDPEEAAVLARELRDLPVPVVAVLGNHDYHSDRQDDVAGEIASAGITVLHGDTIRIEADGSVLGIAGIKGFGGGFAGACATDFGEPEMKAFVGHSRSHADRLERALESLQTDVKIALLHYSPVAETLNGERPEIFPFLGSYLLAEAIDRAGADLALHGHAHAGCEHGTTLGGVPVRNVALQVLERPYQVYCLGNECAEDGDPVLREHQPVSAR